MNLTDTKSRALARDGRVSVVRPMEEQGQDKVFESFVADLWFAVNGDLTLVEPPMLPGDTLPDGSRVVSVEAMRLHDAPQDSHNVFDGTFIESHLKALEREWNETYAHRPDWRYEANPWVWVVGAEE